MLYAFLCYNNEDAVFSWTKEEDDAVMAGLHKVHQRLIEKKKFGPAVRLMPTTAATTLRKDTDPPLVLDGPYAETKEQLLGFYVIDCEDLEEALGVARDFAKANPGGAYEVRPLKLFLPGSFEK
ncbi:MAG: YciI family protein [Caulobacteraceae bacterium]|nr:YciI family protein [Caulobacteraceae bacterium]